jgi:hypothetical protein
MSSPEANFAENCRLFISVRPRTYPPPPREAHRGTAGYPRKDVTIDAPRLNRPTITEPWVRMLAPCEKQLEGPGSQASVGTGNRTAAVPATAVEMRGGPLGTGARRTSAGGVAAP